MRPWNPTNLTNLQSKNSATPRTPFWGHFLPATHSQHHRGWHHSLSWWFPHANRTSHPCLTKSFVSDKPRGLNPKSSYIYIQYMVWLLKKRHLIDLHNSWSLKGNPFHRRRKENYKFIGATETQQHPCFFPMICHDPWSHHKPWSPFWWTPKKITKFCQI